MMQSIKRIIYACLFVSALVVTLLFFVKNNQVLELDYILGTAGMPLPVLVLFIFFPGSFSACCH
jgi:Protein of unknown function (DUF1049).